jgi:alcohol dehydrogenase class IV
VVKNGASTARIDVAVAACMAGAAFGNSMVGAVHAIGHALGGVCHIAHGEAMSILLPHVMEYNRARLGDIYDDLLAFFPGESDPVEAVRRFIVTAAGTLAGGASMRATNSLSMHSSLPTNMLPQM